MKTFENNQVENWIQEKKEAVTPDDKLVEKVRLFANEWKIVEQEQIFWEKKTCFFFCVSVLWPGKHRKMPDFFCDVLTGLSVLRLFLWNMYNFDRRNL